MPSKITHIRAGAEEWLARIGREVTRVRTQKKLTESALGKLAGVSRAQVHRIEAGQNSSLLLLARVLAALDLTASVAGVALHDEADDSTAGNDVSAAMADIARRLHRVQDLIRERGLT